MSLHRQCVRPGGEWASRETQEEGKKTCRRCSPLSRVIPKAYYAGGGESTVLMEVRENTW